MLELAAMIGAIFLILGVAALRGVWRAILGLVLGAIVYALVQTFLAVDVVLIVMLLIASKDAPVTATVEDRDRRRAFMESQDQRADDLFKHASQSGDPDAQER